MVDPEMMRYYQNEDIENYVLTVMNMVRHHSPALKGGTCEGEVHAKGGTYKGRYMQREVHVKGGTCEGRYL